MTQDEQQKIMTRLDRLLNLKIERGCMPGEVEVAAYKIGSLVQKYGLVIAFPNGHAPGETPQQKAEREQQERWQHFQEEQRKAREQEEARRKEAEERRHRAPRSPASFAYIEVLIIGETEKALFCRSQEDEDEFWIPRSQCRDGCERWKRGDSGILYVSRWWAEKEGWL